jgi:predicted Fe-S protein YdhL (DUF1289 family)
MDPVADETRGARIASPCVRLCVIHPEVRLCTGCLRTIDEITAWSRYSDLERRAIMAALPERAPLLRQRRGGRAGRLSRERAAKG